MNIKHREIPSHCPARSFIAFLSLVITEGGIQRYITIKVAEFENKVNVKHLPAVIIIINTEATKALNFLFASHLSVLLLGTQSS